MEVRIMVDVLSWGALLPSPQISRLLSILIDAFLGLKNYTQTARRKRPRTQPRRRDRMEYSALTRPPSMPTGVWRLCVSAQPLLTFVLFRDRVVPPYSAPCHILR